MNYYKGLAGGTALATSFALGWYLNSSNLKGRSLWSSRQSDPAAQTTPPTVADLEHLAIKQKFFATGQTIFSFGPATNYFFATRNKTNNDSYKWRFYGNKTSTIDDLLKSSAGSKVFSFAFTAHGDEFVTYKDAGTQKLCWNFLRYGANSETPRYVTLRRWLHENPMDDEQALLQTFVVFGPGSSYFARDATTCIWHDLPSGLEKLLHEKKTSTTEPIENQDKTTDKPDKPSHWIPRIVALGANDQWVAIWHDGHTAYSLNPTHSFLADLDSLPAALWDNIVLSPHEASHGFAATKLGFVYWSGSGRTASILAQLTAYMQLRAREDKRTFIMSQTVQGKTRSLTVSPNTDWTDSALEREYKGESSGFWSWVRGFVRVEVKRIE